MTARYLGYVITNNGVSEKGFTERIKMARAKIQLLRSSGLHADTVSTEKLLDICESFVISTARYGIHITSTDKELHDAWANLEKDMLILAMGCFTESRRNRLRDTAKLLSLQECKTLGWNGMMQ